MRRVRTRVLPEPAPARMHSGEVVVVTARSCAGLRPSRRRSAFWSMLWSTLMSTLWWGDESGSTAKTVLIAGDTGFGGTVLHAVPRERVARDRGADPRSPPPLVVLRQVGRGARC